MAVIAEPIAKPVSRFNFFLDRREVLEMFLVAPAIIYVLLLVGLPMIALEFLAGSWRALVTFLLCDWLTAPVTVVILWILSNLGDANAGRFLMDPDTGSSAAAHGVIAAAIMMLPAKLAAIGMTILVGITIIALSFFRLDTSLAHFLGIVVGAVFGAIWKRQIRREPAYHVT